MIEPSLNFLSGACKTRLSVERDAIAHRHPRQIAQREETSLSVAAAQSLGAVLSLRQSLGRRQDVAVVAMQVEDVGQRGKLVVAQQPRVGIYLGREDEFTAKGLQHEVVLPEVETRGKTDAVVLSEASQVVRRLAAEGFGAVMRRSHVVCHEDVDVGLFAAKQEGGAVFGAGAEVDTMVEQHKVGREAAHLGHHRVEVGILLGA